jgi:protein TonB
VTDAIPRPFQLSSSYILCWLFSLLFHGAMVGFAIVLMTDLRLAPQPEPFKWDVSVLEPAPRPVKQPARPQPAVESPPVEPQPVVQTVQQVVQQEIRTVTPVVQAVSHPIRSEPQVIARTAQPIETPAPAAVEQPAASAPAAEPVSEPVVASVAPSQPVSQPSAVQTVPVRTSPVPQRDYGWLAETLRDRIEELKRYPPIARMNNWQGKVVLKFVVREDGTVEHLEVVQSSGHAALDEAAMETIRSASPLSLKHELGKPRVTFQFPISYTLR